MAAAAAEAARATVAAATRLGWLALAAVVFVFALGALWLASAFRIAGAVDHCLAVKAAGVPLWADVACYETVVFAAPLAIASLVLIVAAASREAKLKVAADADAQICETAGAAHDYDLPDPELQLPPAPAACPGPERGLLLCGSDEVVVPVIVGIYLRCVTFILVGMLLRVVGTFILGYYPGDVGVALLVRVASGWENAGYFWLAVGHFCLIIPYAVLRVRRFINKVTSVIVSACTRVAIRDIPRP